MCQKLVLLQFRLYLLNKIDNHVILFKFFIKITANQAQQNSYMSSILNDHGYLCQQASEYTLYNIQIIGCNLKSHFICIQPLPEITTIFIPTHKKRWLLHINPTDPRIILLITMFSTYLGVTFPRCIRIKGQFFQWHTATLSSFFGLLYYMLIDGQLLL